MIDGQMGSHELNGVDARVVLSIVFKWIEEVEGLTGKTLELRTKLESVGYGKPTNEE